MPSVGRRGRGRKTHRGNAYGQATRLHVGGRLATRERTTRRGTVPRRGVQAPCIAADVLPQQRQDQPRAYAAAPQARPRGPVPRSPQAGACRCPRASEALTRVASSCCVRGERRWRAGPAPGRGCAVARGTGHGRRGVPGAGAGSPRWQSPSRQRAGRVGGVRVWRGLAGGWRKAEAPEAVFSPTRHRGEAGGSGEAEGSQGVMAWSSGRWEGRRAGRGRPGAPRCQSPPNKGLQATVNSLRSCLAPAIDGA